MVCDHHHCQLIIADYYQIAARDNSYGSIVDANLKPSWAPSNKNFLGCGYTQSYHNCCIELLHLLYV